MHVECTGLHKVRGRLWCLSRVRSWIGGLGQGTLVDGGSSQMDLSKNSNLEILRADFAKRCGKTPPQDTYQPSCAGSS